MTDIRCLTHKYVLTIVGNIQHIHSEEKTSIEDGWVHIEPCQLFSIFKYENETFETTEGTKKIKDFKCEIKVE